MPEELNPKDINTPPSSDVVSDREKLVKSAALVAENESLLAKLAEEERVLAEKEAAEVDALIKPLIGLFNSLESANYARLHVIITEYLNKATDIQLYIDNVSEIYGRVYRSDNLIPFIRGGFCSAFAKVIQEITGKDVEIVIDGDVGDHLGRFNTSGIVVRVGGNAGDLVGYHQGDGEIYIAGNAGYNVGIGQKGGELHIAGTVKSFHNSAFDTTSNWAGKIYLGDGNGGEVLIYDGSQATTMVPGDGNITLTEEAWDKFDVNIGTYIDKVIITPKT